MNTQSAKGEGFVLRTYLGAMNTIFRNQLPVIRDLNFGNAILGQVTGDPVDTVDWDDAREEDTLAGTMEESLRIPEIQSDDRRFDGSLFRCIGAYFTSDIEERHRQESRRAEEHMQLDLISLAYSPSRSQSTSLEGDRVRNRWTLCDDTKHLDYSHRYIDDAESTIYALLTHVRRM